MWVNIGIRVPESFERKFDPPILKKYYHEYDCNIRTRLGAVKSRDINKATTYDLRKNTDQIATCIVKEIIDDVLPVFEVLNSRESILAHRREFPWFDTLNSHLIVLEEAMIYGHLGDKQKARELFDAYYEYVVSRKCEGKHIQGHLQYLDKLKDSLEW